MEGALEAVGDLEHSF